MISTGRGFSISKFIQNDQFTHIKSPAPQLVISQDEQQRTKFITLRTLDSAAPPHATEDRYDPPPAANTGTDEHHGHRTRQRTDVRSTAGWEHWHPRTLQTPTTPTRRDMIHHGCAHTVVINPPTG